MMVTNGDGRSRSIGSPGAVNAWGIGSILHRWRHPQREKCSRQPSCTHLLEHAKLSCAHRGLRMWQDDVTVSCSFWRGHLWDIGITACALAEGGLDVKDALDEGAHYRFAATGRGSTRCSQGYTAGARAAMRHDTVARVYRIAQCNVTAAKRSYHRQPQMHAAREAGRDCVQAAELVTAKLLTVKLLNGSWSALWSWCQAGR